MKNFVLFFCFSCISCLVFSQSTFDKSLNEVSSDLATKLKNKNQKKVVVLYISDVNNIRTVAGKYIADIISYHIVNNPENFLVFDRDNLAEIVEAKKLIDEGYIDAAKAKELGKILAVESIIIGNYTVFPSFLKLSLKAFDVNSGLVVAASLQDLPLNEDTGALLGINISNNDAGSSGNRGFNTPIKSGENINNPGTVNSECETNNTGDYCFTNNTNTLLYIMVYRRIPDSYISGYLGEITVDKGQTQCFYDAQAATYTYSIDIHQSTGHSSSTAKTGQIRIEKCKSKTFIIK
jgi:hypothetical protein